MRYRIPLTVFAALLLVSCGEKPALDSQEDARQNLLDILNAEDRLYRDQSLTSTWMKRKMAYSVWLPNGYDSSKEYPFLYLLHGYGDDSNSWLDKGKARSIAKEYVTKGGTPMVIVMPDGLTSFYSGNWESYFHQELIPAVEKAFRCSGKRAIAGLSMGGYGTLYHALNHPGLFLYAYAMSPAVMGDMKSLVDAQADKRVFPGFTVEVGNQDMVVDNAGAKDLADYMEGQGLHVEYIARDGTHDWNFWQECLPKALQKAGESFK